mmetsp:Transcript_77158/g.214572  ORF Transcript_77158/g.214572 Transcript_77158/m.214572 type:complete len:195 (-) Transcript_77158:94-678(-)
MKLPNGPIFVESPDKALMQGTPIHYKEVTPPGTTQAQAADVEQFLRSEVVRVLARHESLLLLLLLVQLGVQIYFETMHITYREDALFELKLVYPSISAPSMAYVYWLAIFGETAYFVAFFCLGVYATCRSRPEIYRKLASIALLGTIGQLPLAYLNRFNLLIFLLRFITYAYARFHCNLLEVIALLRDEFSMTM